MIPYHFPVISGVMQKTGNAERKYPEIRFMHFRISPKKILWHLFMNRFSKSFLLGISEDTIENALDEMEVKGVKVIDSSQITETLSMVSSSTSTKLCAILLAVLPAAISQF